MRTLRRQRGIGWFGLLFVFGTIAFVAICVIKIAPLYLNEMTIAKAVRGVADDPEMANAEPGAVHAALQRRWDADYIDQFEAKDVKIRRTEQGRTLVYSYEARVNLFYNIYVVVKFDGENPMRPSTAPTY